MASTFCRRNSAAISLTRLELPSAQRYSIAILSPSIQPSSRRRASKAVVHGFQTVASAPSTPICRGLPTCCARAAHGHATAPPSSAINSRRSIGFLPLAEEKYPLIQTRTVPCVTVKLDLPDTRACRAKARSVKFGNPNGAPVLSGNQIGNQQALAAIKANAAH